VDLSRPEESLSFLKHMLDKTGARITSVLDGLESRGSKRPKALRSHAWTRFGADHPDKDSVSPFLIPVVIVGTKYDALSSMESERRKLLCKTLRYVSHTNGASLLFVSSKDESSVTKVILSLQSVDKYFHTTHSSRIYSKQ
jgi:dynein light intermediate chain 2, cytosolic